MCPQSGQVAFNEAKPLHNGHIYGKGYLSFTI